jgi:membrane associated rhomboid family serine protease
MRNIRTPHGGSVHDLEFCQNCSLFWFDSGEFKAAEASTRSEVPAPDDPARRDRRELGEAMVSLAAEARRARRANQLEGWQYIPALLGMPVEDGESPWNRPWTTWGLALVIVVVSVLAFVTGLREAVDAFGFVPEKALRLAGFTFISSFFLHGGIMHLVGNVYFLCLFGDNVEDVLRPAKYLLLLLVATVLGDVLYWMFTSSPGTPSVGASGGISGVLAYYALAFPNARVKITWFLYFRPYTFGIPSRWAFGIWVALQLLTAFLQRAGGTNVNAMAHLGGAVIGGGLGSTASSESGSHRHARKLQELQRTGR